MSKIEMKGDDILITDARIKEDWDFPSFGKNNEPQSGTAIMAKHRAALREAEDAHVREAMMRAKIDAMMNMVPSGVRKPVLATRTLRAMAIDKYGEALVIEAVGAFNGLTARERLNIAMADRECCDLYELAIRWLDKQRARERDEVLKQIANNPLASSILANHAKQIASQVDLNASRSPSFKYPEPMCEADWEAKGARNTDGSPADLGLSIQAKRAAAKPRIPLKVPAKEVSINDGFWMQRAVNAIGAKKDIRQHLMPEVL